MLLRAEAAVRIEIQAMYSAVHLEKVALIETAGFSACISIGVGPSDN
jgi:hypothetical protein